MPAERVRCASCRKALGHGGSGSWFGPAGYALCADCRFEEERRTDAPGSRREVVQAAEARGRALAEGDDVALRRLLHEDFRWTSHTGATLTRDEYIARNTGGSVVWRSQRLIDPAVTVVGETAVLVAETVDVVVHGAAVKTFRMPVTQTWVREPSGWRCLAGHAGPLRG